MATRATGGADDGAVAPAVGTATRSVGSASHSEWFVQPYADEKPCCSISAFAGLSDPRGSVQKGAARPVATISAKQPLDVSSACRCIVDAFAAHTPRQHTGMAEPWAETSNAGSTHAVGGDPCAPALLAEASMRSSVA